MSDVVAPWQVRLADLDPVRGGEQGGRRPCVVVASPLHCRFPLAMTIVVPLTTRDRGLEHHVPVTSPGAGLTAVSWARTDDVRAISTSRLRAGRLGMVSPAESRSIAQWLGRMFAAPRPAGGGAG